jgi:mannose-1-phosphate guanylyltransferase/mannose-6-phosphate isomerase
MIQVTPVILCGGSGTRLWPLSRTGFPKQFLCLTGNESLFQQAAQRLAALGSDHIQVAAPVIVSGEDHRFLASEQLREVGIALGTALLEPVGRNTAPALTLAALAAVQNGQDPVLVVTPADQTIAKPAAFNAAVQQAVAQAEQGNIVILGVTPDKPETGYGYIRTEAIDTGSFNKGVEFSGSEPLLANVWKVLAFVEKPNLKTTQSYLQQGGYFWNAGMFVLRASVWLQVLQNFRPDIAQTCQAASNAMISLLSPACSTA